MRSISAVFLSLLALAALTAADTMDASPGSDPSAQLGMWVGRWTFSGQIYKTAYSDAHPDTGTADCAWSANKGYVICEYFSDNPPHDDLSVMSYSPSTKGYTVTLIHKDRPNSTEEATQNGNTWITTRNAPDGKGNTLEIRTTFVFLAPQKQTTLVEVSGDGGKTWTKMIAVTAVKAA
jgi:hypothetical protein